MKVRQIKMRIRTLPLDGGCTGVVMQYDVIHVHMYGVLTNITCTDTDTDEQRCTLYVLITV